jgi:hypothetical protein
MIYDIEMFRGLFAEGELMVMNDDFIKSLRPLLDDMVSSLLLDFFKKFEESGISEHQNYVSNKLTEHVKKLWEYLRQPIMLNTFHFEVEKKGIFEIVQRLNIDTVVNGGVENRDEVIEKLQWLLDNRIYWNAKIEPRKKVDYEKFVEQCKSLALDAEHQEALLKSYGSNVSLKRYDNLIERISHNKEFFFTANEKERPTHMYIVMRDAQKIEMSLHGLLYQRECDKLGILKPDRRSFLIK